MGHQHQWQTEPPEGHLYFNKTFDQRYADEEDLATNSMLTSPGEIQHLRCMLEKDPDYKNSPSWPKLTEWCSSCTMTRLVDLVLPTEEEKVVKNEILIKIKEEKIDEVVKEEKGVSFMDASTQTPPGRKKRGGQGSRRRRLLAFQLMLTQRQGLPKSRLLCLAEKGARSPGKRRRSTTVLKEEKEEVKQEKDQVHDEEKKRRMEGATVRKLRLAAHQPILRRGVFNLVSSHHRPSTSLKFRVCLSSRLASHPCSSPTSRIYCAARCLGPSLCCVVLVRLGEQFILVFSSHEAL